MRVQEVLTTDGRIRYSVVDGNGSPVVPVIRYLKYLDDSGHARNTLRVYGHYLALFFGYLGEIERDYQSVTLSDMGNWVVWLKNPYRSMDLWPRQPAEQVRSNRTVNLALSAVSGFYHYWRMQGGEVIDLNEITRTYLPARARSYKGFLHHLARDSPVEANILKQKVTKERPKTLTAEQVKALVDACHNGRDKLLLTLLFDSAMRIGEALALWCEDVDDYNLKLHIRDRGELANGAEIKTVGSVRAVDVTRDLLNQIMAYMAEAHTERVQTNHLFITLNGPTAGRPLAYHSVADLFRRLKVKTGIDAWPHILRHSAATALIENGIRIEVLQRRLGHAHYQTTAAQYVHPGDEYVRREWERAQRRLDSARNGHCDRDLDQ